MIWAFGRYCSLFVPFRSVKYDPDHVMKNNIISRHSSPLALAEGYILAKRPMISPINEIVSIDERPVTNEHAGKIQSRLEHLSKSERKVAEVILATPEQAIHSSIAALALEAGVSEPTVNRFCRSLETRGFPDFKLHLAQSLAHGTLYVNRNVDEDDSVESYTGKIFESAMASLDQVHHSLDMSAVNRAVDLLTQAKNRLFRPRLLSGGRSRRDEQIFPL